MCVGIPYIDLREAQGFAMLEIICENYEGFTKREIQQAILACKTQVMVAHPTGERFKQMVIRKSLNNLNIKVWDITNTHTIFGPNCTGLRGETARKKPTQVVIEYDDIPKNLFALHKYVTFVVDVMFVNGFPFLITLS